MANWIIARTVDLHEDAPAVERLKALATTSSKNAHQLVIRVLEGGQEADIASLLPVLNIILPGGESLSKQTGENENGTVTVRLPPACYTQAGDVFVALCLMESGGGALLPLYACKLRMMTDATDIMIDEDNVVPSIAELLAQFDACKKATDAANASAADANEATRLSGLATGAAQGAAGDARDAAGTATQAAGNANTAADKVNNMTVAATALATGAPPTANVSTVDGHLHIALGLPRGLTGATPQITFDVTTGAPGSDAQVTAITGTAENPVIHMTIPRGETGRIENLSINGKPVESGNITLTAEDVGARPSTWTPTAADVHARPDTWLPTLSDIKAYPEAGIRRVALSVDLTAWTGAGPYTAEIARTDVTANTRCEFDLDAGAAAGLTADIEWTTSAGKITLSTAAKPTAALTGTVVLTEVSG